MTRTIPDAARMAVELESDRAALSDNDPLLAVMCLVSTYTLSAKTYRHLGSKAEYVREVGFDAEQQEQMVRKYVRSHGSIRAADAMDLCKLSRDRALGSIPTRTEAMSARIALCARLDAMRAGESLSDRRRSSLMKTRA